jgi:hypothetical protein
MLGAIAALKNRADEAERCYRDALHLAGERGMLPLVARCHAGLAALEESANRHGQAAEHEAIARDLCRRMGIDVRDLGPAELTRSS